MKLIRFNSDYLTECAQLYTRVFNDQPWNDHWDFDSAYERLKDILHTPNFHGLICLEEGKVAGCILGNREKFYDGIHFCLKEMFVANHLQGRGIGRRMLDHFFPVLRENGVTFVYLFTLRGGSTCRFYENNGFVEIKDMMMMSRSLVET